MRSAAREFSFNLEVGQHERLRVGPAFERDARSFANRAVCPIAADEIAAAHLLRTSVDAAQRARDFLAARRKADELDAALDRPASRREMLVQDRLRLGLRDEEQERECGVLEPDVEEPYADDPFAEVDAQLDGVVASLDQRLCDPESPQHLERARLHRERARLVHAVELTIDDPDADAELLQPGGEREARRAGTHDHDVRRCGHGWFITRCLRKVVACRGDRGSGRCTVSDHVALSPGSFGLSRRR
jgi:hypothetical protein